MTGGCRQRGNATEAWPTAAVVRAALERASSQRRPAPGPVPVSALLAHLGVASRSAAARTARRTLRGMVEAGQVERSRRHGVEVFAVSPQLAACERRRLEDAGTVSASAEAGAAEQLPESPQHAAWRRARALAAAELPRLREALAEGLDRALSLLESGSRPHSDVWLLAGERLREDCRRMAMAVHCLHEWAEPDEGKADVDPRREPSDADLDPVARRRLRSLRAGRRNLTLWRDEDPLPPPR